MDQGMTYWLAVEMARELQMRSELLFVSPDWQILKHLSEQSQWIQNWAVASLHKLDPARMVTHTEMTIRDGKIQLGYYLDPKNLPHTYSYMPYVSYIAVIHGYYIFMHTLCFIHMFHTYVSYICIHALCFIGHV